MTGERHKWEVPCARCNKRFRLNEVQVDHVVGCGVLKTWDDLVPFTKTLFCDTNNLQVLCKPCHKIKSKEDRDNAARNSK